MTTHNPRLTSNEISFLWNAYIDDSQCIQVFDFFIKNCRDTDILKLLQASRDTAQRHYDQATALLINAQYPKPIGFDKTDVNLDAPSLFSDTFALYYVHFAVRFAMANFTQYLGSSARKDVREFFTKCIQDDINLHEKIVDTMLEKGLYIRPPYITFPEKPELVAKTSFFGNIFGSNERPLLAEEITMFFDIVQTNALGKALCMGFGQCAAHEVVRQYMQEGVELASDFINITFSLLSENNLPSPMTWDTEVSKSQIAPFSDRLMMHHTTLLLTSYGTRNLGMTISPLTRSDILLKYSPYLKRTFDFGRAGVKIMIENEWLEQPPVATNRSELTER